ncbi:MAG: hypothetical protein ACTSW1_03925 [Candidatus Hodarchaeales archaeon]
MYNMNVFQIQIEEKEMMTEQDKTVWVDEFYIELKGESFEVVDNIKGNVWMEGKLRRGESIITKLDEAVKRNDIYHVMALILTECQEVTFHKACVGSMAYFYAMEKAAKIGMGWRKHMLKNCKGEKE